MCVLYSGLFIKNNIGRILINKFKSWCIKACFCPLLWCIRRSTVGGEGVPPVRPKKEAKRVPKQPAREEEEGSCSRRGSP